MINAAKADEQKIKANKEKYEKLYKGNKKAVILASWDCDFGVNQIDALVNEEDCYRALLSAYNTRCEAVNEGFDNVPVVGIFADVAWLMALAYGCEMIKINGLINAAPLYHTATEAVEMKKHKDIFNYGLYPIICKRIEKFQKRWGEVPLTISDNQSPIDVVTSIFHSEEAMLAMYDEGQTIHNMLDIVTDSMIEINRHFESIITNFGGFQSGNYLPFGMHISEDDAAFISPALYREFELPYVERLSREFGGVCFHCCLKHEFNLGNFSSTTGFMGFDAQPDYNCTDSVLKNMKEGGVWSIHNYPFGKKDDRKESDEETFISLLNATDGKCGLQLTVYHHDKNEALKLAYKVKNHAAKLGRI